MTSNYFAFTIANDGQLNLQLRMSMTILMTSLNVNKQWDYKFWSDIKSKRRH